MHDTASCSLDAGIFQLNMGQASHIRIFRNYVHTPYLLMAIAEYGLVVACVFFAVNIQIWQLPIENRSVLASGLLYALMVVISMISMGVYESRIREGFSGQVLRTAVAIFLIATMGMAVIAYFIPLVTLGRGVLTVCTLSAFFSIVIFRLIVISVTDKDSLKKRVVILGTGNQAKKVALRMRREYDRRGFVLVGFAGMNGADNMLEDSQKVFQLDIPLLEFCLQENIDEIVVALDERRRNQDARGGLPLDELFECRLEGINVCDIQGFIEREAGKLDIELLRPSWMVFSDGFIHDAVRAQTKRGFDIIASLILLAFTWPIMLITGFFLWIGGKFREPVFYRQVRVGKNGVDFDLFKFRSMRIDAEKDGEAQWTSENDPRITRIGNFLRRTRIDELPQILNILKGDMSFVGPRPERPEFVASLSEQLEYYKHRHHLKPGLTGWAQLCYPYGASIEDTKEKLQYDLYYIKNQNLLLDLIILLQTVQIVLVGEGAR